MGANRLIARGLLDTKRQNVGCGNGGLDWELVQPEIEAAAAELVNVGFHMFEPASDDQEPVRLDLG